MKPRVLFVSRERFRLPLAGAQARKWAAVAAVVEPRVLAAAAPGRHARDPRFRLAPRLPFLDGPLFYLLLPLRIARQLREFRPDAALVQGVHEMTAFFVARRVTGAATKAILDVEGDWREATRLYGSPLRRLLNPLSDALAAPAVRRADAVRTISTYTAGLVRSLGVEPAAVFPPYVDADAFRARPPIPLPERPQVLYVGALERVKAIDTLVAAWRLAAPRVPDALLHVVGDGTLRPLVERLANELPARVVWSRRLDAEDVAAALDASWLLCLPSRSEGFGRVALEAACRGRAIVGSGRGGIADVLRDGENGVVVDPDSAVDLADALVRVLGDRPLAERLGAAARRTGDELGFGPDEYAARVEALVRRTLERR